MNNNNNSASDRATSRIDLGLLREVQVYRDENVHDPSKGGCRGYPVWFRLDELERHQNQVQCRSSDASLYRWLQRVLPFRMTGGKDRERLIGVDLLLLAIFLSIHPKSTHDQQAAYIFNEGGLLYSNFEISRKLKEMNITKKVGSTEAYQAFLEHNVRKVELFFSRGYPLGVVGSERRKFIDVDEFGMNITRVNSKYGYSISMFRVRSPGHYTRKASHSVFYAIEPGDPRLPAGMLGSIQNPRHWIKILQNQGASELSFGVFMSDLCDDIEIRPAQFGDILSDSHRVILWDNLYVHNTPGLHQIIEGRNYRRPLGPTKFHIINRPPYQAKYGPVEYKICNIVEHVQLHALPEWNDRDMEKAVLDAVARISNVDGTFAHCGYTADGVY